MNWYVEATDNKKEMKNWFEKRTREHISLVQKYCKKIYDYDEEMFDGLIERGEIHDQSKFEDPEYEPYLYITWQYKCKDDGIDFVPPKDIDNQMNKATEHHVKNNKHHPESSCDKEVGLINRKDRDKPPKELIDATKMINLDIGEMLADWMAMSEEKGSAPRDWAKKNINIRWKFTEEQVELIYDLIDKVWNK
ncbi:MAG TPA: DUF5662 family protein [Candidatus Paceibacterota bacterium]|nr:DUF5662 family protein [Candidatus Paceibacterota bacterium]